MPRKKKTGSQKYKKRGINGTNIVDVGGGGDCFWRVVSHQIDGTPLNFMKIKNKVASFIKKNKKKYKHLFDSENSFDNFVVNLRKKGTWCEGEIEMNAVSILYLTKIRILGNDGNENLIETGNYNKVINIYHDKNQHFRSII